ncbi:MAG TPA: metallophosphoesterase [Longimicrobiales bacterium]|nr:metallophosphoesterase [Longimicrobiales bacterium]
MTPDVLRILFLADSHLGFDLPLRPRVARRRRGHDFLANHAAALEPALNGEVDAVVHGGDVFHRPDVNEALAWQALRPLVRAAEAGVPVFIVPGNHERARIPHARFADHPRVHVFDRARTYAIDVRGRRVAFAGFPFERHDVRSRFPELVERTGWRNHDATLRVLCMHHCAEGATVGISAGSRDFSFTTARDVVRVRDVPKSFAAVLSGHIHRRQALTTDLRGRPLDVPVLYPGSVERTSLAEIGETKGYMIVHVDAAGDGGRARWEFRDLYARPMIAEDIAVSGVGAVSGSSGPGTLSGSALDDAVRRIVAAAPADAVLRIRITGDLDAEHWRVLRAAHVRSFAPDTMNLEIRAGDGAPFGRPLTTRTARDRRRVATERGRRRREPDAPRPSDRSGPQLDLEFAL